MILITKVENVENNKVIKTLVLQIDKQNNKITLGGWQNK